MAASHPHIVFITCHDLGRYLGAYGVTTVHSPSFDRLAAEGILFANAFCTSPGCSPSRAAMATGRYPHNNGVMGLTHPPFGWDLHDDEEPIAALLRHAGYGTHLFGFQHITTQLDRIGFDEFHGFDRLAGCHEPALGQNVAGRFAAFLQEAPLDRPLYMELNLEEPHRPYDQGGATPDDSRGVTVPAYLPPDDTSRDEMAAVQGAIRQADAAFGRVLDAIDAAGIAESTIVLFAADHGLAMPRAKCTLYDAGIEVALMLRAPGSTIPAGGRVDALVSNVDLLPSLLELAGLPTPSRLQGRSFAPLLRGERFEPRGEIFAEKTYHSYYDPMRAIRTDRYKYIRNFETSFAVEVPGDVAQGPIYRRHVELYEGHEHPPVELYDLTSDPWEQENLAGRAKVAEVERDLDGRVWNWMAETGDPLLAGPVPDPMYLRAMAARGVADA
jgi:N-sulfoglucosamine sulfohydrolase